MQESSDKKTISLLIGAIFLGSAIMSYQNDLKNIFGIPIYMLGFIVCIALSILLMTIFINEKKRII